MSSMSTGIAASVLARLKNEADRSGEAFNPLLARYVGYGFLDRLPPSPFGEQILVKGATRFLVLQGLSWFCFKIKNLNSANQKCEATQEY